MLQVIYLVSMHVYIYMETNHISNSNSDGTRMWELHDPFGAHALRCLCTLYKCLENAFTFDNTANTVPRNDGTSLCLCD